MEGQHILLQLHVIFPGQLFLFYQKKEKEKLNLYIKLQYF